MLARNETWHAGRRRPALRCGGGKASAGDLRKIPFLELRDGREEFGRLFSDLLWLRGWERNRDRPRCWGCRIVSGISLRRRRRRIVAIRIGRIAVADGRLLRLDRSDGRKLRRNDRRGCGRRGLRSCNGEGIGAGDRSDGHSAKEGPAGDGDEEKTNRRAHCTASLGKMCCVLSQRGVRPRECSEKARNAASTAMRLPTNRRGMDRRPSSSP